MLMGKLFIVCKDGHIQRRTESVCQKKKGFDQEVSHMLCLIIDERSLLSASDLGEKRIKGTIHNSMGNLNEYFGGLPVLILVGDDYQLPAQDGNTEP
jgi:hypothetical protein